MGKRNERFRRLGDVVQPPPWRGCFDRSTIKEREKRSGEAEKNGTTDIRAPALSQGKKNRRGKGKKKLTQTGIRFNEIRLMGPQYPQIEPERIPMKYNAREYTGE